MEHVIDQVSNWLTRQLQLSNLEGILACAAAVIGTTLAKLGLRRLRGDSLPVRASVQGLVAELADASAWKADGHGVRCVRTGLIFVGPGHLNVRTKEGECPTNYYDSLNRRERRLLDGAVTATARKLREAEALTAAAQAEEALRLAAETVRGQGRTSATFGPVNYDALAQSARGKTS